MFPELISLWQFIAIAFVVVVVGSAVGFFGVFKFMQFLEAPAKPKARTKRKYTKRAKGEGKMQERAAEALTPPVQRKPRVGSTPGTTSAVSHETGSGSVQHPV